MFAVACADSVTEPGADLPAPAFSAHSNGAVVHHDEIGCAVLDGSGNWFPGDFSLPCGLEVATYGNNLNSNLSAQATGVPNSTGRTVHWGPFNTEGTDWAAGYPELTGPPYPCFVLGADYDINKRQRFTCLPLQQEVGVQLRGLGQLRVAGAAKP
jgi:hypothetical protein